MLMGSCKKEVVQEPPVEPVKNSYNLAFSSEWKISSTPVRFEEANLINNLGYGFNRAKISWYIIDQYIFYDRNSSLRPWNITDNSLSDHFVRQVLEAEIYPCNDIQPGIPTNVIVLNINFFPDEKGAHNYDTYTTSFSAGINENGTLIDPETRWGGIMRKLEEKDFDLNYIDFWLMDPLVYNPDISGEMYINLGNISEEVLRDNKHSNEASIGLLNGSVYDTTVWGIVNESNPWQYQFEDENIQDVGFDGLSNEQERTFFETYLNDIQTICTPEAFLEIFNDPSGDEFHHFQGDDYDEDPLYSSIIERYKNYCKNEGNSVSSDPNWFLGSTKQAGMEDLNFDQTLNTSNAYYEYKIHIDFNNMIVGSNYIDQFHEAQIKFANGNPGQVKWYHFKIPIEDYNNQVGNISLENNFETIRIYLTNFNQEVVLRFGTIELTEE